MQCSKKDKIENIYTKWYKMLFTRTQVLQMVYSIPLMWDSFACKFVPFSVNKFKIECVCDNENKKSRKEKWFVWKGAGHAPIFVCQCKELLLQLSFYCPGAQSKHTLIFQQPNRTVPNHSCIYVCESRNANKWCLCKHLQKSSKSELRLIKKNCVPNIVYILFRLFAHRNKS